MMKELEDAMSKPEFIGTTLTHGGKSYTVQEADNYSYKDPIDGSVATKQVKITRIRGNWRIFDFYYCAVVGFEDNI